MLADINGLYAETVIHLLNKFSHVSCLSLLLLHGMWTILWGKNVFSSCTRYYSEVLSYFGVNF